MRTTLVRAVVTLGVVSASIAADDSLLSGFKGKYKGDINFGGQLTGPTSGNVKASRKKENGVIKLRSRVSGNGQSAILLEKFSIRGKRFKYQFQASSDGFSQQGSGSGRARIFKNSIKLKANTNIGGSPYALNSTVTRDEKDEELEITTSLVGVGGAVIVYDLEKK